MARRVILAMMAGALFCAGLSVARPVAANDADLDAGFGTDGALRFGSPHGEGRTGGEAVAVQPDGRIVIAGYHSESIHASLYVARRNADGTPDLSFGGGDGEVEYAIGLSWNSARGIHVLADGRIIVAFEAYGPDYAFGIVRLLADGSLDTTFGTGGITVTDIGPGSDRPYAMAVTPTGAYVLVGSTQIGFGTDIAVVRYTPSGQLDAGFDGDGIATLSTSNGDDIGRAVVVYPDGSIEIAGSTAAMASAAQFTVVRLTAAGQPDITFDSDGVNIVNVLGSGQALSIVARPNRGALVGGFVNQGSGTAVVVALDSSGAFDLAFGSNGTVTIDFGSVGGIAKSLAFEGDGDLIVAGQSLYGRLGIARLRPNGQFDERFGLRGVRELTVDTSVSLNAIAVQPDGGTLLLAAVDSGPRTGQLVVTRLRPAAPGLGVVAPRRVLDTRSSGRLAAGSITRVVTGAPAWSSAVLVNVTMTDGAAPGYITADRCSALVAGPQTKSNGNFGVGQNVANGSVVPIDADGSFCIYNETPVSLVVDLQGTYRSGEGLRLSVSAPRRVLDTRSNGRLAAGSVTRVVTGAPAGTSAVLVNLTMTDGAVPGYITADRCSALVAGPQTKSNGNFGVGQNVANGSVVPIDADGSFCIYNETPVSVLVDVQGVYLVSDGLVLDAQPPRRLLDTRGPAGRLAAGTVIRVVTGAPAGTSAVLVNLTMTDGAAPGYITADRCSALVAGPQTKSNGNFGVGQNVANGSVVPIDADGSFCIYNETPVGLVVDLQGTY